MDVKLKYKIMGFWNSKCKNHLIIEITDIE